jgi:hypothetical protein
MDTYTITLDSTQSSANTSFTVQLAPEGSLTSIFKIEILRASIYTTQNTEAVYLYIDELAGQSRNIRVVQDEKTFNESHLRGAILSWNTTGQGRSTFLSNTHWDAHLLFDKPKDSLTSLSISLYDQSGHILPENKSGTTYLTLRIHCKRTVESTPEPIVPKIKSTYQNLKTEQTNPFSKYGIYALVTILLLIGSRILFRGGSSSLLPSD